MGTPEAPQLLTRSVREPVAVAWRPKQSYVTDSTRVEILFDIRRETEIATLYYRWDVAVFLHMRDRQGFSSPPLNHDNRCGRGNRHN